MQLITDEEYQAQIIKAYYTGQYVVYTKVANMIEPEATQETINAALNMEAMMREAHIYYQAIIKTEL